MDYFKWRGIIEGFYGRCWTLEERRNMMQFMGKHGMNMYIYAPKDDPYHRAQWAVPYPDDHLFELKELVKSSFDNNVTLVFALSPGLSIEYANSEHFNLLLEKYRQLQAIGVDSFGLFFDDIPVEPTEELAKQQASLTNRLFEELANTSKGQQLFCPTIYHGEGKGEYVQALGNLLIEDIAIMWTGRWVCSPVLNTQDTYELSEILKRPVFYWDNYPVNDLMMSSQLHIGPYINRDADLYKYCNGVVANPMSLAESSKIGLATIAAYLNYPANYNHKTAWQSSLEEVVDGESAAFYRFAQANLISPLHGQSPPRVKQAIDDFWDAANKADFKGALEKAGMFFVEMVSDVKAIRNTNNAKLVQEMDSWLREYEQWGEIGKLAVGLIKVTLEYFNDPTLAPDARNEKAILLNELRTKLKEGLIKTIDFQTKVCGEEVRNFAQDVYRSVGILISEQQ